MADGLSIPGASLTPFLIEQLLSAARSGLFKEAVAPAVGVSVEDLDTWLTMGLSPNAVEPYKSFARLYAAAEAGAQLPYVAAWQQAATVEWKAAQAWLAARYPEQWGLRATKTRQAIDLQPSESDTRAEEEMVRQLLKARPPVLMRLLEEEGLLSGDPPAKKQE
jgi:hypothetical protein